ncbi:hypothetical protein [Undibacterium sp.]|uniref:hypothetical protein n=1 Tax=Undibacterium sp. TaxID=1914977 RepID=UPI00374D05BC
MNNSMRTPKSNPTELVFTFNSMHRAAAASENWAMVGQIFEPAGELTAHLISELREVLQQCLQLAIREGQGGRVKSSAIVRIGFTGLPPAARIDIFDPAETFFNFEQNFADFIALAKRVLFGNSVKEIAA